MDERKKIGGPNWGNNKCPDCGKVERRYYLGSWDWEPKACMNCFLKQADEIIEEEVSNDLLTSEF